MSQGGPSRFNGSATGNPIETITGNTGGAITPDGSLNFNLIANTSMGITTIGTLASHQINILGIQSTTTQIGVVQLATDAQAIAGTDTANAITSSNLAAKLGSQTLNGLPIGAGSSSALSWTASPLNGQLLIGSSGASPVLANLSAGAGISIANGAGSITIANSVFAGGGLTWNDVVAATQTVAAGNGYIADRGGGVAFSLPVTATIGDVFRIVGLQGSWTLSQAAGQQIKFGNKATTAGVGGSLASTDAGDCIECLATNTSSATIWRVMSSIGNITVV